ncbi:unnamed protein product [Pseudo-nitzschia multistriata]|uniref:Glycosyl transferase family 1 domain-containing protein n=1 Tax=Pseudo-nitzschia multistriata TaxID=183589 RepID=A0A448ZC59_9STRA|nr:unnamed protein product [Pseudo-nitzschia multistriata]
MGSNRAGAAIPASTRLFRLALLVLAAVALAEAKTKKKIALVTAGLPWSFGPYQSQMHQLSLLLRDGKLSGSDDSTEYDIYWVADTVHIPSGVYRGYRDLRPHIGKTVPPKEDFPLDHITFLGWDTQMKASTLNQLAKQHGIDLMITLMDISRLVPDEALKLPVVAWIPLHSATVERWTSDYWSLRSYHGIAGLAPSGAAAIEDAVGKRMELGDAGLEAVFGKGEVAFVPHMFDREALNASADKGLGLLGRNHVALVDAELTGMPPILDRARPEALEAGGGLFETDGENRPDPRFRFVVLLQGGNYDKLDRKGWDTSLQAFARFYHSLDDPSGIHLLIHSMESYLVASDSNNEEDAPPMVLPQGYNIRLALHELGLPKTAYTVDQAKHAPEVVAAYKKRADVCLHPSKVEGFGMNVMECQIVGTPVVTTKYTAMEDYTKFGRSVPPLQTIRNPDQLYSMAMPDVEGIAEALGELYLEHKALAAGDEGYKRRREQEIASFNDWLETTCSPDAVADKFGELLPRAIDEFWARETARGLLLTGAVPTEGAYEVSSGYHATIADWDAPWTLMSPDGTVVTAPEELNKMAWMMLLADNSSSSPAMAIVVPPTYEDGTKADERLFMEGKLPLLVRTYVLCSLQGASTRFSTLMAQAINVAGNSVKRMPDGVAMIDRNTKKGATTAPEGRSEL